MSDTNRTNIESVNNIYITNLIDRLRFDIKLDITKVNNPWIVSSYQNIVPDGYFRCNKVFYQKGNDGVFRRVFAPGAYSSYLVWDDGHNGGKQKKRKVLTFKEFLIDSKQVEIP